MIHNETRTLFTEGALTIVNCVLPDDLDHLLNLLKSGWNTEAASHTKARYEEDIECKFKGVLLADGRQHFSESFLLQHQALSDDGTKVFKALKKFENEIGSGMGFGYRTFNLTSPGSLVEIVENRKSVSASSTELLSQALFSLMADSYVIDQILSSPYITKTVKERPLAALQKALRDQANQIPIPCQTALFLIQLAVQDGVFSCQFTQKSINDLSLLVAFTRTCRSIQQFVTAQSDLEITSAAIGNQDLVRAEAEIRREEANLNAYIHSEKGQQQSAEFVRKHGFHPTKVNMLLEIRKYREDLGMQRGCQGAARNIPV